MPCEFCNLDCSVYLAENEHFFAIGDKYPVSKGHTLIISKRHTPDYFTLSPEELVSLHAITLSVKKVLEEKYEPRGYNLAMNCGSVAGQSIPHFHLHIIPRFGKENKGIFPRRRESVF